MTTRGPTQTVKFKGRKFVVRFDEAGDPHSIKERKLYAPGKPWQCWKNAPYWHHSAPLGGPKTIPRKIIEMAKGGQP